VSTALITQAAAIEMATAGSRSDSLTNEGWVEFVKKKKERKIGLGFVPMVPTVPTVPFSFWVMVTWVTGTTEDG
jgi:hypothetical protein